jgi:hypothetical protein
MFLFRDVRVRQILSPMLQIALTVRRLERESA